MGILWSCGNSKKSICCDNVEIALNCDRRKWEIKAIAPILSEFSEVDSISYFWPIDPESRNRIFKAKENNIYIIFQYCDYHFESGGTLRYYADAFSIKMKASGATQMSMISGSNSFISEYFFYSAAFHDNVYLIAKIFKIEKEIITVFGMNASRNSSFTNRDLYEVIKRTELIP